MRFRAVRAALLICPLAGSASLGADPGGNFTIAPRWIERSSPTDPVWSWEALPPGGGARIEVRPDGIAFESTGRSEWSWRVSLLSTALGRPSASAEQLGVLRDGSTLETISTKTDGLSWRLLVQAPGTSVQLELTGSVAPTIAGGGDALDLAREDGQVVLSLRELRAEDAAGRSIPLRATLQAPPGEGRGWLLTLDRDESAALYPVLIRAEYSVAELDAEAPCEKCDEERLLDPCDDDVDDYADPACGGNDCNDNDPTINPGATEIPGDGINQNCDGGDVCYTDVDNDGFGVNPVINSTDLDCFDLNEAPLPGDCNDNNPAIRPGAVEIPGDAIDQDCNGGDSCYTDVDNDNFGVNPVINSTDLDCFDLNEAPQPGDCNDSNPTINPAATEIPGDAVNQNCNGGDACYTDVDNDNFGVNPVINSTDLDCFDFNEAPLLGDCHDGNASIYPGAPEIPADGINQDCNAVETCYQDVNNDDFGSSMLIQSSDLDCTDVNEANLGGDCHDGNPSIYPGAPEACNGVDDDCDTVPDDGFAAPTGSPTLTLADLGGTNAQLNWTPVLPSTGYDVVMGDLLTLRGTAGNFTSSTTACVINNSGPTSTSEGSAPAAGGGVWYLVRPVNCQADGTYDSASSAQQGGRDAEIILAGPACP